MNALIEDLSDYIREIGEDCEINRHRPAPMLKGRVQGRPEEKRIPAVASIQELTRRDLAQLPEGMRNSGVVQVFIDTEVLTTDTSECRVPDRIDFGDGRLFQVQKLGDWNAAACYYEVTATRVGR
jgi:hypothetical protein